MPHPKTLIVAAFASFICTSPASPAQTPTCDWQTVTHPAPDHTPARFEDLYAAAPDDIWAVGHEYEQGVARRTLIMHYDGTEWTRVPSPSPGPSYADGTQCWLHAVDGTGPDNIYAVGVYNHPTVPGNQPLVLHYDGSEWTHMEDAPTQFGDGLTGMVFEDLVAINESEIWVAAIDAHYLAPMLHFDGSDWTLTYTPDPATNGYSGMLAVDAIAPDYVWAVGGTGGLGPVSTGAFASLWDGSNWTNFEMDIPGLPYILTDVVVITEDDAWATGRYRDDATNTTLPYFVHFDGSAWTQVESPTFATGLIAFASDDIWGVAGDDLVHYDGESWSVVAMVEGGEAMNLHGLDGFDPCSLTAVGQEAYTSAQTTAIVRTAAGLPGDLNSDAAVDLADLNMVLASFGTSDPAGDTNGDGTVDLSDLNLVLANFGT